MSFSSIPILDFSLHRSSDTKPSFLASLRTALLEVGFLYLKNTGIDNTLIENVIEQGKAFFDLPEEKKLELQMKNVPSFLGIRNTTQQCGKFLLTFPTLGYSKLGNEVTQNATDWPVIVFRKLEYPALTNVQGVSKLTYQQSIHCPHRRTPFITTFDLQTNGPTRDFCARSVRCLKPTFVRCPFSLQHSLPSSPRPSSYPHMPSTASSIPISNTSSRLSNILIVPISLLQTQDLLQRLPNSKA